jgi:hypothetical protein
MTGMTDLVNTMNITTDEMNHYAPPYIKSTSHGLGIEGRHFLSPRAWRGILPVCDIDGMLQAYVRGIDCTPSHKDDFA